MDFDPGDVHSSAWMATPLRMMRQRRGHDDRGNAPGATRSRSGQRTATGKANATRLGNSHCTLHRAAHGGRRNEPLRVKCPGEDYVRGWDEGIRSGKRRDLLRQASKPSRMFSCTCWYLSKWTLFRKLSVAPASDQGIANATIISPNMPTAMIVLVVVSMAASAESDVCEHSFMPPSAFRLLALTKALRRWS